MHSIMTHSHSFIHPFIHTSIYFCFLHPPILLPPFPLPLQEGAADEKRASERLKGHGRRGRLGGHAEGGGAAGHLLHRLPYAGRPRHEPTGKHGENSGVVIFTNGMAPRTR